MASRSEGDVFVIFIFSVLVGPWVSLEEVLNCLPDCHIGVEWPLDGLTGEWICPTVFLQVLFYGLSLVSLSTISSDWVLHEFEGDPAGEVVGDAEDRLFIGCF